MLGPEFEAVLQRAAAGDSSAFASLWRDCQPMLLRYLTALAGNDAEDVASETWLEMASAISRFQGDEHGFHSLLVTIGRRRAIDRTRRMGRRPERLVGDLGLLDTVAAQNTEELAAERFGTEQALRLVSLLPSDQAELVLLRVVVGLEPAEIARIVGRTPGSVRVSVHRGLRTLAEHIIRARVTPVEDSSIQERDD